MNTHNSVSYNSRSLGDWVDLAFSGKIALADFQRSFVWTNDGAIDYIKAILEGKPVGLYLVLEIAEKPQFKARAFHTFDDQRITDAEELILDGQQRMTSLLKALYGGGDYRYFIRMRNLDHFLEKELEVEEIEIFKFGTRIEQARKCPQVAYEQKLVPMDVLIGIPDNEGIPPLARWCDAVWENNDANKSRALEHVIHTFFEKKFFKRELWCCFLPRSTSRPVATEIFINTNKSSVRVSAFDIQVASVRGGRGEDLRTEIRKSYGDPANSIFRHYFKEDPEDWIPEIGEWLLKVACLHNGRPPRKSSYELAVQYLFPNEGGQEELYATFGDLLWALNFVTNLGAVTKRTLPSWPPLHVLAATKRSYCTISDPTKICQARQLLESYYWRSLFSDRYDADANRRLFDDFRQLKAGIKAIRMGDDPRKPPVFDENAHPLHDAKGLYDHARWIGQASRLGRAIASLSISPEIDRQAVDWVTGAKLTPEHVRDLENNGNLERHHIFPKSLLSDADAAQKTDSGLNGVLLDRRSNRRFSDDAPQKYVRQVIDTRHIDENGMRSRIESHVVPYSEMIAAGDMKDRYEKFLQRRAEMIIEQVLKLAKFPS